MKVIKPGVFLFVGGVVHADGWVFDGEGVRYPSAADQKREVLRTVISYLAVGLGVDDVSCTSVDSAEHLTLESERAALDAIAMVRWPACGD